MSWQVRAHAICPVRGGAVSSLDVFYSIGSLDPGARPGNRSEQKNISCSRARERGSCSKPQQQHWRAGKRALFPAKPQQQHWRGKEQHKGTRELRWGQASRLLTTLTDLPRLDAVARP